MKSEKEIRAKLDKLCDEYSTVAELLAAKETYFEGFKKTIRHDVSSLSFCGEICRKLEMEIWVIDRKKISMLTQIETLSWVLDRAE
ncbi:hypothetical protein KZO01_06160 [Kurthia zopfii]|uniref:Uncharacterized protein n=1 Tax=Kurthia zopfii TaxID=1650 RepID=A0A8B4Q912_9BACL|nr:hypothetical protein [Kurthia zopfii]PWI23514.1 hypothetical protein DF281_02935 [Kurthia zopfii]TDR35542.1 hypothetical protein DFR61_13037 [Kurthia zopfii]GEK30307.1 hypothetical protein KZO01_06160 [Kurthia zopfii]STX09196.1 Uncharacterised protein [Kurthia zopfii]